VDIAMFCIYSLYNKKQVDRLINIYFHNKCSKITRAKIYAYISMCGLLWSNWCEFKAKLGVEFGEYSLRQYRFAKDYYRYTTKELDSCQEA
jgi:thiamine kinase-like enzyme